MWPRATRCSRSCRARELLGVRGTEAVGPYTLLRLERGGLEPGLPGQFFMLEAPGRVLPRPMSLCLAPDGELAFLIDPIGPGTRALCALDAGRRDPRARPARQRLRPRGRAAAARRRRDRDRAVAVPLRGARPSAGAARLPERGARGGGRAPAAGRGGDRAAVRHGSPAGRPGRRARVRPRADARGARVPSFRARSSPGRRRWPADTARATAASSRSTATTSALRLRARCSRQRDDASRSSTRAAASTRSRRLRRAEPRRLRDEDGHAAPARGKPAAAHRRDRARDAELDRAAEPGNRRVSRATSCPVCSALGVPIWVSVGGFSAADYASTCERLDERDDVATIELNLSCPNVEEAPGASAELVQAARAATRKPLYAKLSPATWDIAENATGGRRRGRGRAVARQHHPRARARPANARAASRQGSRRLLRPRA